MATTTEHYTATVTITQTVRETTTTQSYDRRIQPESPTSRGVQEVARLVIRGVDLDDLRGKIAAHAALL